MNHQELLDKLHREQVKDDFFSMFYHDLRNPLTAVIGSIDIVREGRLGALNGEQSDYLQSAIDSCNEVVAMIENLLDVRRFEAGKMQLTMQPLDPAETVRSAAHACERAAAFDSVTVITDIHDSPFTISANHKVLARIMGNLLGNSLKFTPEGGEISVSCRCMVDVDIRTIGIPPSVTLPDDFVDRRSFVRLSVRDNGDIIPAQFLEQIFDCYTQTKNREGRERGSTALSLAYCRYAVEKLNGVIWVANGPELDSEVIILFPCTREQSVLCTTINQE